MNKTVFFAFRGDPMCFIHVLLNALDMAEKGMEGKIVIEGDAVKLIPEMAQPGHFLNRLYRKVREKNLLIGACLPAPPNLALLQPLRKRALN